MHSNLYYTQDGRLILLQEQTFYLLTGRPRIP